MSERKEDFYPEFQNWLSHIENPDHRQMLETLFHRIHDAFPFLKPKIAWNQPMLTDHETFIIGFSAAKKHFALTLEKDGMAHFQDPIKEAGYSQTVNLMRIEWTQQIDFPLIFRMMEWKIDEKKEIKTFWKP